MLNTRSTTPTPLFRLLPLVVTCIAAGACSDTSMTVLDVNGTDSGVRQSRTQLDVAGGQSQVGQVNEMLSAPLGVKVTNQAGDPLVGVTVYWDFTTGGGTTSATGAGSVASSVTTTTDNSGVARVYWLLGTQAGDQQATAGLNSNTNKGNGKGNGSLTFYAQATPGAPTTVVVSPRSATLSAGKDTTLTAAVSDKWSNPIANAQVAWSAGPSTVATVNGKGRVSTLSPGSATVTATAGSATGAASISVTGTASTAVAQIATTPSSLSFSALGSAAQLTPTVRDSAGSPVTADLQWSSLDPGVATVDANGLVKAMGNGSSSVIVSATCCGVADTVAVSVAQVPQTVTISSSLLSLPVGGVDSLFALVKDANGYLIADATLAWSSSDVGVAMVDSVGVVSAVAQGSATITAATSAASATSAPSGSSTLSSVAGQASVVVSAPTAATVSLTPDSVSLTSLGATAQLTAVAKDSAGNIVANPGFIWTSLDSMVATVSASGLVTAKTLGTIGIVVSAACCGADTVSVDVTQVPAAVVTSPSAAAVLTAGDTQQFTAVVQDANGWTISGAPVIWSSSDTTVATVSSSGLATAASDGTATISATSGAVTGSAALNVGTASQSAGTPVWQDGFETGDKSHTENGYAWASASNTGVSSDRAYSGNYSLKFTYGPDAPLKDSWSEQRFQMGEYLSAVWIEYMLYVPTNFYHRKEGTLSGVGGNGTFKITGGSWTPALTDNYLAGATVKLTDAANATVWTGTVTSNTSTTLHFSGDATGATKLVGSPNNNKFLLMWKDDYGQDADWLPGFEYRPSDKTAGDSRLRPYTTTYTQQARTDIQDAQVNLSDPFIGDGGQGLIRGQWNQVRIEFKAASGKGTSDGVMKLWINGTLFFAKTDGDFWNSLSLGSTTLHNGYVLGWSNSGFTQKTELFVDDVRFYDTDPGWR